MKAAKKRKRETFLFPIYSRERRQGHTQLAHWLYFVAIVFVLAYCDAYTHGLVGILPRADLLLNFVRLARERRLSGGRGAPNKRCSKPDELASYLSRRDRSIFYHMICNTATPRLEKE